MLGYPGQTGRMHRPDGKARTLRVTADPVIYVCPAFALHEQLVFNPRNFKFMEARSVALSVGPFGCSLLHASSALHRPSGCALEPTLCDYEATLNALLFWRPVSEPARAAVCHDPIFGLPTAVTSLMPILTDDGIVVILTPVEEAPPSGPRTAAPGPRRGRRQQMWHWAGWPFEGQRPPRPPFASNRALPGRRALASLCRRPMLPPSAEPCLPRPLTPRKAHGRSALTPATSSPKASTAPSTRPIGRRARPAKYPGWTTPKATAARHRCRDSTALARCGPVAVARLPPNAPAAPTAPAATASALANARTAVALANTSEA